MCHDSEITITRRRFFFYFFPEPDQQRSFVETEPKGSGLRHALCEIPRTTAKDVPGIIVPDQYCTGGGLQTVGVRQKTKRKRPPGRDASLEVEFEFEGWFLPAPAAIAIGPAPD